MCCYLPVFSKEILQSSCFGVWRKATHPHISRGTAAANYSWTWLHTMLNGSWLNSASNSENLWCSDFYASTTLTLVIFCRPWISVSWRAAKQRLKQQIKEKAKVNKTLETKKPQQMQWIGTFFLGKKNPVGEAQIRTTLSKASLLFLGRDESGCQPICSLDQRNLLRFVQLPIDTSKKEEGEPPSRGLRLFYSVLSKSWQLALILLERSK